MPIEHRAGGTTLTGDAIDYYRLCSMRAVVSLELKGIRVTRGPVVWKRVAKEFGIKGNKQAVYDWLDAEVARLRPLQEHVVEDPARPGGRREVAGEEVQ